MKNVESSRRAAASSKYSKKAAARPAVKPSRSQLKSPERDKISGATVKGPKKSLAALDGVDELLTFGGMDEDVKVAPVDSDLDDQGPLHKANEIGASGLPVEAKMPSEQEQPEVSLKVTKALAPNRFERALERASRGEAGPIKIADLYLENDIETAAKGSVLTEYYRKLIASNPDAQPGRPLVNVTGDSEDNLTFQLLTLYEMVLAARDLGREVLQVSLVRVSPSEAAGLLKSSALQEVKLADQVAVPKTLTLSEIADVNGFSELALEVIERDQNIRTQINVEGTEFRNLRESIRSIGLQNPPVVEVREGSGPGELSLVCISGHRRLLALEALGVKKVVCALKKFESVTHRTLAGLAENINREDLHFLDKASGYGQLVNLGMSTAQIAVLLDGDVRTIGKYVRAASWDEQVKARVRRLGSKITVRYLLNSMAAGERSTLELQAMLDRIEFPQTSDSNKNSPAKPMNYQTKIVEFCQLMRLTNDQVALIQKAMKYLGVV